MVNKFRVWDQINEKMIYPEDEEAGTRGQFPVTLAVGLHGLPVAFDKDSFKQNEIIGWNVDNSRVVMRCSGIDDKEGSLLWDGDLRLHGGKLYKIVDHGFVMKFERNLVEFGENDWFDVTEDTAYESTLVGTYYEKPHLMLNYKK